MPLLRICPMSLLRVILALTIVHAVGVIAGVLLCLNVLRLAVIHLDRGEELTRWSRVRIIVGHFFVHHGYSLFIFSSSILAGLWVVYIVRATFRQKVSDRGNDGFN
jgi:hypothetical protein